MKSMAQAIMILRTSRMRMLLVKKKSMMVRRSQAHQASMLLRMPVASEAPFQCSS